MKKTILFFSMCALFAGCSGDEQSEPLNNNDGENKVLLLKVDYTATIFEGGKELLFSDAPDFTIAHDYQSPADFGGITLKYAELNEKIFEGTIVWAGLGEMAYPAGMEAAASFGTVGEAVAMPEADDFRTVIYDEHAFYPEVIDYQSIWSAVDNLEVVAEYRENNPEAKVHLFLYTPSVGIGNPEEWDWFVILKN